MARQERDIFDEIDEIFESMERRFEDEFETFFRRSEREGLVGGKRFGPFVYGWSMTVGPDGKPIVRQFGNVSPRRQALDVEREPLVDVNETDSEISVVVELPGVDKSEIKLNVTEDTLEVRAGQKYYKLVELPSEVVTNTSKATYKNGVLEVKLRKREKKDVPQGFNVPIE
jgi:HSP20 family protein